jgi:hypothetical protein
VAVIFCHVFCFSERIGGTEGDELQVALATYATYSRATRTKFKIGSEWKSFDF